MKAAQTQNRVKETSKCFLHNCQQCADSVELPGNKQEAPVLSVSADRLMVDVLLSGTGLAR